MRRSPRLSASKVTLAVVEIHQTLAGIPTGINYVVRAVAIDIRDATVAALGESSSGRQSK
jgi:hypothetical protein